jgi:hypothetical protein
VSILAGVFSRSGAAVPPKLCDSLNRAVSRDAGDERIVFQDQRCCLVKVDTGAYGEAAVRTGFKGTVSLLAGEPLLALHDSEPPRTRSNDLALLHEAWTRDNWDLLRGAHGVFCAVHYQPDPGRITLVADKLGIRQLYYWLSDQTLIFATALRVLEQLEGWPRIMDLRAITEIAAFGFPLGTRTPYSNVHLLRAAEIVNVSATSFSRRQYWRWDAIASSRDSEAYRARVLYDRFTSAVARRLRRDTATVAFLSGGLDSRCIVAVLRDRKVRVHTFNFAAKGTQDQMLGAVFARHAGTQHTESPTDRAKPHWSMLMAAALAQATDLAASQVQRARLVWSGDGGSVGLGHVYMNRPIVDLLRADKRDSAIELFLQQQRANVLRRLLQPEIADAVADVLRVGIREELEDIRCEDPARSFHLFLMVNDQRRHLAAHFEDLDLHRLEFHLPFFDSGPLELIVASPVDECLGHRLYMRFAAHVPSVITDVPWQSYPGHAPCPLPLPQRTGYQWDNRTQSLLRRGSSRELLQAADALIKERTFPDEVLRRRFLQLARWAHGLKLRDYSYVIQTARLYDRYWKLCDGRYELPTVPRVQSA